MSPLLRTVVVLAMVAPACGGDPSTVATPPPGVTASPSTAAGTTTEPPVAGDAACGPVESVPRQGGEHLIGDQQPPVPYNSTPPTSGWHSSGAVKFGVQPPGKPLSEPEQVSVLEAGGVVVSYAGLSRAERRALAELVRGKLADRVAVTAYDALPAGSVALTAWGRVQRCDGVDVAAVREFFKAHLGTPKSGADH